MHTMRTDDPGRWTIDRLHQLPADGNRYELVDGKLLVTPAPSREHQMLSVLLFRILDAYVRDQRLGFVFFAPSEVQFIATQEAVEPDLMVIPAAPDQMHGSWEDLPRPILVVEILSPSTRRHDLVAKHHLYLRENIPAYWIVDGDARHIRVAQPGRDDVVVTGSLEWCPEGCAAPLSLDIAALFLGALGPS